MLQKVAETISKNSLLQKGDRILVAVSGGPDSVALLHVLTELKKEFDVDISVVHLNHLLRGKESNEDARFVRNLAKKLQLPVLLGICDVKAKRKKRGGSLEEVARKERYDFYRKAAKKMKTNIIALGHTANDNAETLLMNLLRGAGIRGLSGIPMKRKEGKFMIIRPLLNIKSDEIIHYLNENELSYRVDRSNVDLRFTRNKIRHRLIPLLARNYNANIVEILSRTAAYLHSATEFLYQQVERLQKRCLTIKDDKIIIKLPSFRRYPEVVQMEFLRSVLRERYDFKTTPDLLLRIQDFILTEQRAPLFMSKDVVMNREFDELVITREKRRACKKFEKEFPIPGEFRVKRNDLAIEISAQVVKVAGIRKNEMKKRPEPMRQIWRNIRKRGKITLEESFDADKLSGTYLTLRSRKEGDKFSPIGMKGSKKVKELFIDEKIPCSFREKIPLLLCGNDILWIVGYRISEKYKIIKDTRSVLSIKAKITLL